MIRLISHAAFFAGLVALTSCFHSLCDEFSVRESFVPPEKHYVCYTMPQSPTIDGILEDAVWKDIPFSSAHVDIREGLCDVPKPYYATRFKAGWTPTHLYIAAELEEPHLFASLTQRDTVIFYDPDFEVFLNPTRDNVNYVELEMNALNTVWDLFLPFPYRASGIPLDAWNIAGLQTAVHCYGTLNDNTDSDQKWTLEIAIPFESLAMTRCSALPPRDGDLWGANFSRVEWPLRRVGRSYARNANVGQEENWVWAPTGIVAIHMPESWGLLQFSTHTPNAPVPAQTDSLQPYRNALMRVYHGQCTFFDRYHRWCFDADKIRAALGHAPELETLVLKPTANSYEAVLIPDEKTKIILRANSQLTVEVQ